MSVRFRPTYIRLCLIMSCLFYSFLNCVFCSKRDAKRECKNVKFIGQGTSTRSNRSATTDAWITRGRTPTSGTQCGFGAKVARRSTEVTFSSCWRPGYIAKSVTYVESKDNPGNYYRAPSSQRTSYEVLLMTRGFIKWKKNIRECVCSSRLTDWLKNLPISLIVSAAECGNSALVVMPKSPLKVDENKLFITVHHNRSVSRSLATWLTAAFKDGPIKWRPVTLDGAIQLHTKLQGFQPLPRLVSVRKLRRS